MARTMPVRLRTVAAACVVIASGLIIFNVYQKVILTAGQSGQALPVIAADNEPFRILPEDPGGADIPNQGSLLFEVLKTDRTDPLALDGVTLSAKTRDDALFTDEEAPPATGFKMPEPPETRTESLYGMIEDLRERDGGPSQEPMEVVEKGFIPAQEDVSKPEPEPEPEAEPEPIETLAKVVGPLPVEKPAAPARARPRVVERSAPPATATPAPAVSEVYYIQLASLQDEAAARSAYERIARDFPSVVAGLKPFFPKADLGARGTFTRIQAGPLSQDEAKERCAIYTASSRGGTCLVVSR